MRKIDDDEIRKILSDLADMRGYFLNRTQSETEAGHIRLNRIEDRLRTVLGEPPVNHRCYHICPVHPEDKETRNNESKKV